MVPATSEEDGVSVAVAPETLMDAETFEEEPDAVKKNVEEKNDELLMAREKVALTLEPVETPVAPEEGETRVMTGGCTTAP